MRDRFVFGRMMRIAREILVDPLVITPLNILFFSDGLVNFLLHMRRF